MSRFTITDGDGPKIPPDDAASRTFGIVGQRGTGKSSVAAVLVEGLVDEGARAVVCDPTGVWWGLAHAGTGPGLANAVILGGEHQNGPLEETGGQVVADLVTSADYSVVVLDMKLLRKAAQVRFMADFLEALYHQNRDALHVVMDEAGRFAPQVLREKGGYGARLLGAIEDVVKLGRSRGLGCTLVEQRPAHINKSVFEQIETLVAMRLMGPNDRKAISDWIEAQGDPAREKEVMDAVAKFGTGTGLLWSPAFLDYFGVVDFRQPRTYDSRRTPRPGERRKAPGERAQVDLASITAKMAESIERAKQDDPKHLRAEIARLKAEIAKKPAAPPAAPAKTVEIPVLQLDVAERLKKGADRLVEGAERLAGLHGRLIDCVAEIRESVARATAPNASQRAQNIPRIIPPTYSKRTQSKAQPRVASESAEGVSGVEQRILNALAELEALGANEPERVLVGFFAGYSNIASKGFANGLGALHTAGRVRYGNGTVALTEEGRPLADASGAPQSTDEAVERVVSLLKGSTEKILRPLVEAYPAGIEREELGRIAGYGNTASKGFANAIGRLRTLGFIDYPTGGTVAATKRLFPGAAA